jgi:hypothetical protein
MRKTPLKIALLIHGLISSLAASVAFAADIEAEEVNVYQLGTYYGEDSSYALQLNLDFALTSATRLSFGGAYVQAKGNQDDIESYQGNVELDHRFGAWGLAIEGNYRDDDTTISTVGARARAYYRGERLNAGVRLGRNQIEISYDLPPILRQYFDDKRSDHGSEYGLDLRYSFGKFSLYTSGTDYAYDEPLNSLLPHRIGGVPLPGDRFPLLQERLARARARLIPFSFATLRLATNLLDYSVVLGGDYTIGEHVINLELARQRVALNEQEVDSVDLGWTIPIATAVDMEIRVGSAMVQDADSLFYGSLNFTFFH